LEDISSSFRLVDYYQYSTAKEYVEAHTSADFRQLLLTQLTILRTLGVKENFFVNYLSTPSTKNYTELGYGLDIGIRFPIRFEVVSSFIAGNQGFSYLQTGFKIGLTRNLSFAK
tara:strand:+ start:542 stop:883 length:342 start_codon:yes stop_codon:yes gene_type:complete